MKFVVVLAISTAIILVQEGRNYRLKNEVKYLNNLVVSLNNAAVEKRSFYKKISDKFNYHRYLLKYQDQQIKFDQVKIRRINPRTEKYYKAALSRFMARRLEKMTASRNQRTITVWKKQSTLSSTRSVME